MTETEPDYWFPTTLTGIYTYVPDKCVFVTADGFTMLFDQEHFQEAFLFHPYPAVVRSGFIRDMGEPHGWTAEEILRREA